MNFEFSFSLPISKLREYEFNKINFNPCLLVNSIEKPMFPTFYVA